MVQSFTGSSPGNKKNKNNKKPHPQYSLEIKCSDSCEAS